MFKLRALIAIAAFLILPVQAFVIFPSSARSACRVLHAGSGGLPPQQTFGDEATEELALEIASAIKVPLVPSPVVKFVSREVISKLSTNLSTDSTQRLQEMMQSAATRSRLDDFSDAEINAVADQIARELSPGIDVPMLEKEQELKLLQQILRSLFARVTRNDKARQKLLINTTVGVSQDLLGSKASRKKLASAIKAAVDIPILQETQKESVIEFALESCSSTLKGILPPELVQSLAGESPVGIEAIKEFAIQTINSKVDIVGLTEKQEEQLITALVNILIDQYVDGTDAEYLLLSDREQLDRLRQQRAALQNRKQLSKRKYRREQSNLKERLERVNERIKMVKRKRSIFNRIFRRGK